GVVGPPHRAVAALPDEVEEPVPVADRVARSGVVARRRGRAVVAEGRLVLEPGVALAADGEALPVAAVVAAVGVLAVGPGIAVGALGEGARVDQAAAGGAAGIVRARRRRPV